MHPASTRPRDTGLSGEGPTATMSPRRTVPFEFARRRGRRGKCTLACHQRRRCRRLSEPLRARRVAEGMAFEHDDVCVVEQTVHGRRRPEVVPEQGIPLLQGPVRREDDRAALVTLANDLVEVNRSSPSRGRRPRSSTINRSGDENRRSFLS